MPQIKAVIPLVLPGFTEPFEGYEESKEYCLEQEKASRLHARLLEMLPEEGRATLMEYGEAVADAHYLEVMILAERAFLEGVRLVVRAVAEA